MPSEMLARTFGAQGQGGLTPTQGYVEEKMWLPRASFLFRHFKCMITFNLILQTPSWGFCESYQCPSSP